MHDGILYFWLILKLCLTAKSFFSNWTDVLCIGTSFQYSLTTYREKHFSFPFWYRFPLWALSHNIPIQLFKQVMKAFCIWYCFAHFGALLKPICLQHKKSYIIHNKQDTSIQINLFLFSIWWIHFSILTEMFYKSN